MAPSQFKKSTWNRILPQIRAVKEAINTTKNLLYAIRDAWETSSSMEARYMAAKLRRVLDAIPENEYIVGDWESSMKCDPPDGVTSSLEQELERYVIL